MSRTSSPTARTPPAAGPPERQVKRRRRLRALSRAVSWHRRKLAVVAAVAAVLTGVSAALPPDPPTSEVVSTARQVDGGATLTTEDVTTVRLPPEAVPDGAVVDRQAAVGRRLTSPVARGQVLTELDLVRLGRSVRTGRVVAPMRLSDGDLAALLRVGDVVDVLAADSESPDARIVARGVRVVGLPPPPDGSSLGGPAGPGAGALVLVDVDTGTATTLAQAAVTATLSVLLR